METEWQLFSKSFQKNFQTVIKNSRFKQQKREENGNQKETERKRTGYPLAFRLRERKIIIYVGSEKNQKDHGKRFFKIFYPLF